ncbi:hypothetical protein HN385_03235 [archaeon]|jgi:hypothetical protein|nr:hypothetical protein [archaeon]MBT3451374.1 hypothetical protein [archaeon]MBT6868494.1 hypothetical protein [archaeon]MBT7193593.1 hypothetical protein [archaeon]MBT7381306.1 hypothetical protein [archaeon]
MEKLYIMTYGVSTHYMKFKPDEFPKKIEDIIKLIKEKNISFHSTKLKKTGDIALFLGLFFGFSKRFIDIMKENEINNFKEYKIKISSPKDCQDFYYLDIKSFKPDRYKKKIFMKRLVNTNPLLIIKSANNYFKYDDWGGEHIFMIKESGTLFCTEKVKNIVKKNNLKNFRFRELEIKRHLF